MNSAPVWVLEAVFALAALEKGVTLKARSARWHPMMLANARLRRHAVFYMAVSLGADLIAMATLLATPGLGAAWCIALITVYTFASFPVHHARAASCRCFYGVLNANTLTGTLTRNVLLAGLAVTIIVLQPTMSLVGLVFAVPLLAVLWALVTASDHLTTRRLAPAIGEEV